MTTSPTRRALAAAVALALVLSLAAPVAASAATAPLTPPPAPRPARVIAPSIAAAAGTLQSMDGTATLWSRNATTRRQTASTIKMLNALVVRQYAKLTDVVVVTKQSEAISNGDVGLVTGQRLTVAQLLQMMLVASANDAAEAVGIGIAGSEANYVRMMNAKAKELGLKGTHAVDPHGLGKRQYSTAADLAVLAREVMKDPVLRSIVRRQYVMVPHPGAAATKIQSTDKLLGVYSGMEGVKTGFTNPAGDCFVGAAKRGNVELVGVVLGTSSNKARFTQMRRLLDWGFAHYRNRQLVSKDATAGIAVVSGGVESTVSVHPSQSFSTLEFDGSRHARVVEVATSTAAPVAAGQQLGHILVVKADGSVIATVPLVADKAIAAAPQSVAVETASAGLTISGVVQRLFAFIGRIVGGRP